MFPKYAVLWIGVSFQLHFNYVNARSTICRVSISPPRYVFAVVGASFWLLNVTFCTFFTLCLKMQFRFGIWWWHLLGIRLTIILEPVFISIEFNCTENPHADEFCCIFNQINKVVDSFWGRWTYGIVFRCHDLSLSFKKMLIFEIRQALRYFQIKFSKRIQIMLELCARVIDASVLIE